MMTKFAVLGAAFAAAHVAGTRRQGAEAGETVEIVKGVSAQRGVLGQNVYDAEGQVVGKIEDLILTKKIVAYAIVGVGWRSRWASSFAPRTGSSCEAPQRKRSGLCRVSSTQ
jgi:hypothetical protein